MSDTLKIIAALNACHGELAQGLVDAGCAEHCGVVDILERLLKASHPEERIEAKQELKILRLNLDLDQ